MRFPNVKFKSRKNKQIAEAYNLKNYQKKKSVSHFSL